MQAAAGILGATIQVGAANAAVAPGGEGVLPPYSDPSALGAGTPGTAQAGVETFHAAEASQDASVISTVDMTSAAVSTAAALPAAGGAAVAGAETVASSVDGGQHAFDTTDHESDVHFSSSAAQEQHFQFGAIEFNAGGLGLDFGNVAHDGVPAPVDFHLDAVKAGAAAMADMAFSAISAPTLTAVASLENAPAASSHTDVTSASVGARGATAAQVQQALDESGLNVNGTGIKVGVISDSFNDLGGAAQDESDGALPSASNIDVIKDLPSGGTDEGRAMMQIVHDIAPGASMAFYTADESEQDFANGILALAAAGCKVICDDVAYYDEPYFQNGIVAQAIQTVEAEGVTYVTAAGNNASNAYEAAWTQGSGTFDGWTFSDAEMFNGSIVQNITVTASTADPVPLILQWSEPYGDAAPGDGTEPAIDMFIFQNGSLIGQATSGTANEPNNPFTGVDFTASGTYQIVIANNYGPNPGEIKEMLLGDGLPETISGANAGTVYGHAMTPGAITAGAVSAADTPAFGYTTPISESFSSSGAGTELLFSNNGTPLSSPDVLNPIAVSGIDDIATTVGGNLADFYGTSAASASLAGVAALILAANPNLTPAQVEQIMEETATPMTNSAVAGAGLVNVDAAVALAEAHISLVASTVDARQGGAAIALLSGTPVIIDPTSTTLSSAMIKIANASGNPVIGDELYLDGSQSGSVGSGVSVSWNATTDTLTLSGSATLATYETLLGEITYQDTGVDSSSGHHPIRTITWDASDGSNSFSATSQVSVDRAPVAANDSATDMEGSTVTATAGGGVLSNDTDLDGDHLTVTGVSDTPSGSGAVGVSIAGLYGYLTLNADGSYSYVADNSAAINSASNGLLHDIFTYTVSDSNGGTSNAALNIAVERPPEVTTVNITSLPEQTLAASSLFTVNDPDGLAITEYQFWDRTSDPASGHFYFNGVEVADHTLLDVTAAQLSEVTFVTGTDPNALEVRAYDGVSWSAADSAVWAPFNVNITVPPPPVLTTTDINSTPDQTLAASSLFTVTDPDGLPIIEYQFWDRTSDPASGHFYFNGVEVADHTLLDVTAAQLSEVTFVTGTDSNALEVRAFDGVSWSAAESAVWAPFNVDIATPPPPVVTTVDINSTPDQTLAASSLFTVSDPDGLPIIEYQFWDRTSDPASGHFYFNGVEVADHALLDVTAAQLSEVTFVTGTDSNALEVRAYDGVSWSAADSAVWAPFNVDIAAPPAPVVTTTDLTELPNQTLAASSLFTVSDPDGLPITEYQFWDRTSDPASGHFYFNGVEVADHTLLDVTAAQLSEVMFVTGTDSNALEVRAFDGVSWSAAENAVWAPFNVDVTAPPPPVVTTPDITATPGQTMAASSLFTVSDPDGLPITEYQFWDRTSDPASGHFYFNGVEVAPHTLLDVTAAQLSEVTFVAGTDSTALEVRAFDGVSWSATENAVWAPFNVNPAGTGGSSSTLTIAPSPTNVTISASAGLDNFVFAPNFGQVAVTGFAPASGSIQIEQSVFANVNALLAATHDNAQGNAVISDAHNDTITFQNVTTAQLIAHQNDFHFV